MFMEVLLCPVFRWLFRTQMDQQESPLIGPFRRSKGDVYGPSGLAPRPLKTYIIFIKLEPLWMCEAFVNILTSIVSNSRLGKRLADVTIFGFHVDPNVSKSLNCY